MDLLYISEGNIPSLKANSIQVMKMSQAFSSLVEKFELVTLGDIFSLLTRKSFNFLSWYGIERPFKITRLPLKLRCNYPFPQDYHYKAYPLWASRFARFRHPDLVYTRSPQIVYHLLLHSKPVILEIHELFPRVLRTITKGPNSRNLLGIVTINDALAQNYIENGIPEEKILVLPDGVDLERFTPPLTKQQARETIGLNPELFIASYVGHLYENRGIETIFECAKLLPEVFFHLVGGCEEDVKRRKEEAQSMKLDNVKMEGFVPNSKVPYYLASADVLLMPYSRNCKTANWMSPLKLFEYMAAQKPIIASDLQAIRQVLNSHNAVLIEPDYANHLANAIVNLKNNPGMMEKIAFLARKDAEKFTWQNRAREILNFSQSKLSFYLNDFRNNSNGEAKRKK